ncbi:FecR family protein [Bordetella genomosp. 10]|nr:FecR family protein [Bordetella genomosp. 10]
METPDALEIPNDPHDAAAYWFAREHGGLMSDAERPLFERWRQADARHEQAYQEMCQVWRVAEAVPDRELRAIVADGRAAPDASRRRYLALGMGTVCTAAVAAAVLAPQWWRAEPSFTDHYATQRGERRQIVLPDDSVLTLNTASSATARFYEGERVVVLEEGEAMFEVSHDKARPFIVETGVGRVRVTGTRFNVRRDADDMTVTVESGSVEVSTGSWWHRHTATLTAGLGVDVTANAGDLYARRMDVAALTAWRQGKAVFDGTPLFQVVDEMNRYRGSPIRVQGALRQLRIAGVFSVDNTNDFLAVLPTVAPVRVVQRDDGGSEIVAR